MTYHPLRIAAIGFNGSAQAALELFFNRYPDRYQLVDVRDSQAIIYNADRPQPLEQQYALYNERYAKPGLVVSIRDIDWPDMQLLKKPYSTDELVAQLSRLETKMCADKEGVIDEDAKHQQVLDEYRRNVRRGRGEDNAELAALYQEADRRRAFQSSLFERKRNAQQHVDALKQRHALDIPQEVIENTEQLKDLLAERPPVRSMLGDLINVTDADILGTTQAVVKAHAAPSGAAVVTERLAAQLVLLPVSEQDVRDCCGASPDVSLKDPGQRRHVFFNAEGQLLSMAIATLERAHQEQSSIAILGLPGQKLEYHPDSGQFYSNIDLELFVQMAHLRFSFGELQLQSLAADEQREADTHFIQYTAEQLLWKLACWSSRGRLIEGMGLGTAYQLHSELASNVMLELPYTKELIELWQTEPLSALDVIERLQIPQRFLFPFMTAAWILDWLQKQQPVADAQS